MVLTHLNITQHELIGLRVRIIHSDNPSQIGIEGAVVDETRNTLTIRDKGKVKKVLKSQIKMEIEINDAVVEVDGKVLLKRPEERVKRKK